jgi:hypothetical protein
MIKNYIEGHYLPLEKNTLPFEKDIIIQNLEAKKIYNFVLK